jgi:hypothetical protein
MTAGAAGAGPAAYDTGGKDDGHGQTQDILNWERGVSNGKVTATRIRSEDGTRSGGTPSEVPAETEERHRRLTARIGFGAQTGRRPSVTGRSRALAAGVDGSPPAPQRDPARPSYSGALGRMREGERVAPVRRHH